MARKRSRTRYVPRANPKATKANAPLWPWLLGGGILVAGGVFLYSRRASASSPDQPAIPPPGTVQVITAPPPGSPPDAPPVVHNEPVSGSAPVPEPPAVTPPPPPPPGSPPVPPSTPPPVAGTPSHSTLVSRLSSSDAARQVFAYQALMYEWNITGAVPDGLMGPVTAGLIRSLDIQSSISPPSGNFRGATSVRRLVDVIRRTNGGNLPAPRLLPFTLPRSVISQVNATGTRIGSPILLQIHAT